MDAKTLQCFILNRCSIKSKWFLKVKRNGVYKARIDACGYCQIPGVAFSDNYSPVVILLTTF